MSTAAQRLHCWVKSDTQHQARQRGHCAAFLRLLLPITGDLFSQDKLRKYRRSETGSTLPWLMEISSETCSDRQPISRAQSTTEIKYQHNRDKHFPTTTLLGGAGKLSTVDLVPFSWGQSFSQYRLETPEWSQVVELTSEWRAGAWVRNRRELLGSNEAEETQVCRKKSTWREGERRPRPLWRNHTPVAKTFILALFDWVLLGAGRGGAGRGLSLL